VDDDAADADADDDGQRRRRRRLAAAIPRYCGTVADAGPARRDDAGIFREHEILRLPGGATHWSPYDPVGVVNADP
jgi:hypothetical protein